MINVRRKEVITNEDYCEDSQGSHSRSQGQGSSPQGQGGSQGAAQEDGRQDREKGRQEVDEDGAKDEDSEGCGPWRPQGHKEGPAEGEQELTARHTLDEDP